jgi:hypothetical protein
MFALGSPRGFGFGVSRSTTVDVVVGRVVCIDERVGSELTFPITSFCESCVCEEGPEDRGIGGSEGECFGIHGFSCSNHPSCSRRLFLVIEHHEY